MLSKQHYSMFSDYSHIYITGVGIFLICTFFIYFITHGIGIPGNELNCYLEKPQQGRFLLEREFLIHFLLSPQMKLIYPEN